jgi:hypothetical protein
MSPDDTEVKRVLQVPRWPIRFACLVGVTRSAAEGARLASVRTDAAAAVATLTARARMRVSQTGAQGSAGTPVLPDGRYSRSNRPGTRLWPPSIACQVWPHVAIIQR